MDIKAADLEQLFRQQKKSFEQSYPPALEQRLLNINKVRDLVIDNREPLADAISEDFGGRSYVETMLGDASMVISSCKTAERNLAKWMKVKRRPIALQFRPAKNTILPQPLGVVGIMAPWNYPLQLALCPMIAALAAGNRVMLKLSERVPHTTALLSKLLEEKFIRDEVTTVSGGPDIARAFASLPFNHLLFTGSGAKGREVALQAARNLTPVTLELGGKSPVIVDPEADRALLGDRVVFGKCFNGGQSCVAPDYLLVPRGTESEIADILLASAEKLYPHPLDNPDYAALIDDAHYARALKFYHQEISAGTDVRAIAEPAASHTRKFPFTVLINPDPTSPVMTEEIFAPLLPILGVDDLDAALTFIRNRPRPLALYWFGKDPVNRDRVLHTSHAGGVALNDTLWHVAQENLPFGGIGESGMGYYHGEDGFRTFSHLKPIFTQSRLSQIKAIFPPYGPRTEKLLKRLKRPD